HDVVLRREAQYRDALADDGAFHKRYMSLPFEVPDPAFLKTVATLPSDEGITVSTAEGLAKLKPVVEGGSITYGGQNHPPHAPARPAARGPPPRLPPPRRRSSAATPISASACTVLARRAPRSPTCRKRQFRPPAPRSTMRAWRSTKWMRSRRTIRSP